MEVEHRRDETNKRKRSDKSKRKVEHQLCQQLQGEKRKQFQSFKNDYSNNKDM